MKFEIENCKNTTAKRNKVRTEMTELLLSFLKEKFEDEDNDVVQVGANEIAVCVAIDKDKDGFSYDMNMVVKAEVKPHLDSIGEKGRDVKAYDRLTKSEDYQRELKLKQIKKKKEN